MKKLIALALSILLGSSGYVIVDHTINDRVEVLESQVESLNGAVSSLAEKCAPQTTGTSKRPITTLKSYSTGEIIPIAESQKMQFNIHYLKYQNADHFTIHEVWYDSEYNPDRWYGIALEEKDYKVDLTKLSFVVESSEVIEHSSEAQYTTTISNRAQVKVKVTAEGQTSPELVGKKIGFDLIYDKSGVYTPGITEATSLISSDGSFTFEQTYTYTGYSLNVFSECYLVNPIIK